MNKRIFWWGAALTALAGTVVAAWIGLPILRTLPRIRQVNEWINTPQNHPDWAVQANMRCGTAPFQLPTDGFVGFLWDDSWKPLHRHQGIDIFGGTKPGITPVYAAADGYLTRKADWKSTLVIRVPDDPLHPGRQIWLYYTHLADENGNSSIGADFPAGTSEVFVHAGTLLGTQGNFSGVPGSPVGVHLHFSIVLDDGEGNLRNELKIGNTLDPSPYLGLELNSHRAGNEIQVCKP